MTLRSIKHVDHVNAAATLQEARANLESLQRYADRLVGCTEGVVFINLLAQTAQDALLFALHHFHDPTKPEGDHQ